MQRSTKWIATMNMFVQVCYTDFHDQLLTWSQGQYIFIHILFNWGVWANHLNSCSCDIYSSQFSTPGCLFTWYPIDIEEERIDVAQLVR